MIGSIRFRRSFHSAMKMSRAGMSGSLLCCEFGPDQMPVIGAQVAPRYFAIGGGFDSNAVLRTRATVAVCMTPLPDLIRVHAKGASQVRC